MKLFVLAVLPSMTLSSSTSSCHSTRILFGSCNVRQQSGRICKLANTDESHEVGENWWLDHLFYPFVLRHCRQLLCADTGMNLERLSNLPIANPWL
eukprot:492229-Amphidinium_carterae.1